ncbi:glycoside hydrolase family 16 protein [Macrolepiota fuliginosa MF-IS2]|uniref:Glycoside hydrolase family 16 protein n=1 Tax=Macrolepiota fuliginosa MF-IS2 TaxID=1400762 RepID=A0A9P6C1T9_9AGAR|nr:glycoside hydrolase family 16 protein [Macrolepiota fuliginosa MF-IS2]
MKISSPVFLSFLVASAHGATYTISDIVAGPKFFDFFEFQTIPDPVHGRVNYVDRTTALKQNLTFAGDANSIVRADFKTVLNPKGPGRNSVRIRSKKTYMTHVAVFDVHHMPQGCGTWPAIREMNVSQWPNGGGLVDMLEGVNDQTPNVVTLHTNEGCTMPASRDQTGISRQNNCNRLINNNAGCGVESPTTKSYGPPFNSNGGGWYIVERASTYIKIFFWPRDSTSVPDDVRNGSISINTDMWGTPIAFFPDTSCNMTQQFSNHNIVIGLSLCGDWAGGLSFGESGCPGNCVDFVNNNPGAFTDAYFDFASIRIYQSRFKRNVIETNS